MIGGGKFLSFLFLFSGVLYARGQYCIAHVNIVDVEKGTITNDQTVCIEGNRIRSISAGVAGTAGVAYLYWSI
jgi:hypothetical protein